jgi:hypothetical protein
MLLPFELQYPLVGSILPGLTDRLGVAVGDGVGVGCEQLQVSVVGFAPEPEKVKVPPWQGMLLIVIPCDVLPELNVPLVCENETPRLLSSLTLQLTVAD